MQQLISTNFSDEKMSLIIIRFAWNGSYLSHTYVCHEFLLKYIEKKKKSPINGVESVTGNISPTMVANIVIANMIVTSEGGNVKNDRKGNNGAYKLQPVTYRVFFQTGFTSKMFKVSRMAKSLPKKVKAKF